MKKATRRLLGIVLIFGGITGLGILGGAFESGLFALCAALVVFYLANIVAGWWLWTNPRLGVLLTFVLQTFQLIYIDSPTFKYHLANAASAWLKQTSGLPQFSFHWGSSFYFARTTGFGDLLPNGPTYYGINFVPIAVAILACALWPSHTSRERTPVPAHADTAERPQAHT